MTGWHKTSFLQGDLQFKRPLSSSEKKEKQNDALTAQSCKKRFHEMT